MSRIEELEKQITELDERKVELQKELELEKQKTEIECPFEERERYFLLCNDGSVPSDCWDGYDCEFDQWSQGNIFKTEQEAIRERDRRNLLQRFRQFKDKCNGDWKPDFTVINRGPCTIYYDETRKCLKPYLPINNNPFSVFGYFQSGQDCQRAIELFGDEIKRLYMEE